MGRGAKVLLAAALLFIPASAAAQVAWDGPFLVPPRATGELGVYLMEMEGGGLGVMAAFRSPGWNYGLRGGIAESGDDIGIFGGIDFAGALNRATDEFPLDIDWVFGAGVGAGNGVRVSVPVGLTGGHTFRAEGADITPWITPRVHLDAIFGRDVPEGDDDSDVGLGFAFDLGVDLRLSAAAGQPLSGVTIRFGASMGDRQAIALGLVF